MAPQSALARRSIKLVSNEGHFHLKTLFTFINTELFGGKVPPDTRVTWSKTMTVNYGLCSQLSGHLNRSHIRLNKSLLRRCKNRDLLIDVLAHEMIHVLTFHEAAHHGPQFLKMMEDINKSYRRKISVTVSDRYHFSEVEKKMVHRWKCLDCGFTYKRSIKMKQVPKGKLDEHSESGCVGELTKLTMMEAKADIALVIQQENRSANRRTK